MTPTRRRRLLLVVLVLLGVGGATALALQAFRENLLYYYTPSKVVAGESPDERQYNLGGMVEAGSVQREPGSLEVRFVVTDFERSLPVRYRGVLPDLFREGQGVIARGRLQDGEFIAEQVLAKHDETYMPPEMAEAAQRGGHPGKTD